MRPGHMPFLLLLCLMAVCMVPSWPTPRFGMGTVGSLLFTVMAVGSLLLAAGIITQSTLRRLQREPEYRDDVAHRYSAARTYHFFATIGVYLGCLFLFGWGNTVMAEARVTINGIRGLMPAGELLILAPFLVAYIGSWLFFYDADYEFYRIVVGDERAGRFWSRLGFVVFLARQQLILLFVPLVLMMIQQGIIRFYPEILRASWLPIASLLVLPTFLIFFPPLLPRLLGLKPLPAGPTRERLEAHAKRLGFGYRQIYLWNTRGVMANAMVVGIARWLRYVVFTDRLLDELTPDEVDAVFGHEVGHAHHGHIIYYAVFILLSYTLIGAAFQLLGQADETYLEGFGSLVMVLPIIIMGAYMFIVFGFISRRCERQADVFGCRAGSCNDPHCMGHEWTTVLSERGRGLCRTGIEHFVNALRRVDAINGLTKPQPLWRGATVSGKVHWIFRLITGWLHTWLHSSIEKRVRFLEQVAISPSIEQRFQKRIYVIKWALALSLLAALAGLGAWQGLGVLGF